MNEAFEMECPAFIAGGETAEVLEAVKTPLDTVSLFVSDLIVRILILRVRLDGITTSASMALIVARKALLS